MIGNLHFVGGKKKKSQDQIKTKSKLNRNGIEIESKRNQKGIEIPGGPPISAATLENGR